MSTGSLAAGICYESPLLAADAYFGGLPPVSYYAGSTLVTTSYVQIAGVWNAQQTTLDASGVSALIYTSPVPVPAFAPCYAPSESFADGVNIGWAFAVVFGIVFYSRIVTGLFKNV